MYQVNVCFESVPWKKKFVYNILNCNYKYVFVAFRILYYDKAGLPQ